MTISPLRPNRTFDFAPAPNSFPFATDPATHPSLWHPNHGPSCFRRTRPCLWAEENKKFIDEKIPSQMCGVWDNHLLPGNSRLVVAQFYGNCSFSVFANPFLSSLDANETFSGPDPMEENKNTPEVNFTFFFGERAHLFCCRTLVNVNSAGFLRVEDGRRCEGVFFKWF
jgi:hypothetical protein